MNKLSPDQIHAAKFYFNLFQNIPEEKWCKGALVKKPSLEILIDGECVTEMRCAMGHLSNLVVPADPLNTIFALTCGTGIVAINDEKNNKSAKQNILGKLKEIIHAQ